MFPAAAMRLGNEGRAFANCAALDLSETADILDLTTTTNVSGTFMNNHDLRSIAHIDAWNTSGVVDMSELFRNCYNFNADLSRWDMRSISSLHSAFANCHSFSSDLSEWQLNENLTDLSNLFANTTKFNANLNHLDLTHVKVFDRMFEGSNWNNGGIELSVSIASDNSTNSWNTASAISYKAMFSRAHGFNQSLGHLSLEKLPNGTASMENILSDVAYNSCSYAHTLIQWADRAKAQGRTPHRIEFTVGNEIMLPCNNDRALGAKQYLASQHEWVFTDLTVNSSSPCAKVSCPTNNTPVDPVDPIDPVDPVVPSPTPSSDARGLDSDSLGAGVGIGIGAAAFLTLLTLAIYFTKCRSKQINTVHASQNEKELELTGVA